MAKNPHIVTAVALIVCFRCDPAASVLNRVDLPRAAEEHKVRRRGQIVCRPVCACNRQAAAAMPVGACGWVCAAHL